MSDKLRRMRPAKRIVKLQEFKDQLTEKINGNKKLLEKLRAELGGHIQGGTIEGIERLQRTISMVEKELVVQANSAMYITAQMETAKVALRHEQLKNQIESRWSKIERLKATPPKCDGCELSDEVEYGGDEGVENKAGITVGTRWRNEIQTKSIPSIVTWYCRRCRIRFRTILDERDFPKSSEPVKKVEHWALDPITHRYVEVESSEAIKQYVERRQAEKQAGASDQ